MKILRFEAENVKRLVAVEIRPDGNLVIVAGNNAQGKSSVLDAIWLALQGKVAGRENSDVIRHGETKAHVTLHLDDELVVTRRWQGDRSALVVEHHGARPSSPQSVLDRLLGQLSFDPLAFAQQKPKDQVATLLSVVTLPFDPEQVEAQRRGIFENRTEVSRDLRRAEAQLAALSYDATAPADEVSSADLAQALSTAQANAARWEQVRTDYIKVTEEVAALQQQLAAAQQRQSELWEAGQSMANVDYGAAIAAARERLSTADEVNRAVRANREYLSVKAAVEMLAGQAESLTATLKEIDEFKAKSIANAQMPVPGLSFNDDGVLYNGVPFTQASAAEQLRVSIAMAMALNPTIRVIRITDGSLLDENSLAMVAQMAADLDFQVWIERVGTSGPASVVIEDGAVVYP